MLNAIVQNLYISILLLNPSVLLPFGSPSLQQPLTKQQEALNSPGSMRSGSTSADPHDPVSAGGMQGATAKAWQAFTQDGRYRWAGKNDFRFPDWSKQGYGMLDIERAMKTPVQAGHIKGSYESTEVALIVVDTTRTDWNRYGVVIFSEQRRKPQSSEMKWLFRDKDLSRVQLGWSSGDTLNIAEYKDDGSFRNCFVKWDAKRRKYLCNLKRVK